MAFLTEKKFSFISKAPSLTPETFAVVRFKGFEAISKLYEFDIMLVSDNPEIDLSEVLQKPARFTVHRENDGEVHYNGMIAEFYQLHEFGGYIFYRARLVPKLWWLTLTHHNQVFLGDSVSGIIQKTLIDGGLTTMDFEFKTQREYNALDYVCQYGETHFNF
ncbi:MAG TPA: contractile injection system protein, VgrG/Pvc8 family, partial [Anaerolineae bacterium]|nr:contractile injection system protein, VgrG/Pvc8 family [Anaerolineae bacterium]